MGQEAERLRDLLDACHRVLPHLGGRSDRVAEAIRATCTEVEQRLAELGAVSDNSPSSSELESRA
jgi:hypothetical protein